MDTKEQERQRRFDRIRSERLGMYKDLLVFILVCIAIALITIYR